MASYKARPQIDPLVRERIENQKRAERAEARKTVLLDARTRQYGKDLQTLSAQVDERTEKMKMDKQRDLYYDDVNVWQANQIKEMERARQAQVRADRLKLESFRSNQAVERDMKRQEAEAKFNSFGDIQTDFLKFQGEDLDRDAREKAMYTQQQDWLQQQIAELSAKEKFEKEQAAAYDATQAQMNEIMKKDEIELAQEMKYRRHQLQAENQMLADEKRSRETAANQLNSYLNDAEIKAQLNSAYLNESFVGTSDGRAGFKGFSQEQRQSILDEQEYQRQQLALARQAENQKDATYDQQQEEIRRMMILADRQKQRNKTQDLLKLREERKTQHLAKTEKYEYLDTVMFSDPIRPEYFEQFGTSGR